MLRLLHFLFSPICPPQTCTLWRLPLQAGLEASEPQGDILQQMGIYTWAMSLKAGLWVAQGSTGLCLPPPMLHWVVVSLALGVYAPGPAPLGERAGGWMSLSSTMWHGGTQGLYLSSFPVLCCLDLI